MGKQVFKRVSSEIKAFSSSKAKTAQQQFPYFADEPTAEGVFFSHLFLKDGTIKDVLLKIAEWSGKGSIEFVLSNKLGEQRLKFVNAGKGEFSSTVGEIAVKRGDLLKLVYTKDEDSARCSGINIIFSVEEA